MNRFVVLALVIVALVLPFWRFYRTRRAGESFNAWWIRTELRLLETLGSHLRASLWLTPPLFLRSLFAVGRVTYGIFWLMALLILFGDAVNLSWSWQKLDSPLPVLGVVLEALMLMTILGYWRLFEYGHPETKGFVDAPRLGKHWLMLLGYVWLTVQGLAWGMADPQFLFFRMAVVGKPLKSNESFEHAFERMKNASDEDLDRWIETRNMPRGFTWQWEPRRPPAEVLAQLQAHYQAKATAPEIVALTGGEYYMGCDTRYEPKMAPDSLPTLQPILKTAIDCDYGETPRHLERIAPFSLGKYEVTFEEWDACVADGGCAHWPDDGDLGRGKLPVTDVSWDDAQEYIAWLNRKTGQHWRLPSEAEWEYAARAGSTAAFGVGHCLSQETANTNGEKHGYTDCPETPGPMKPLPVGSLKPNAWGLHDMHGNVAEWVSDCRSFGYKGEKCPSTVDKKRRGHRGGSWKDGAEEARSAHRSFARHDARIGTVGFRLAHDGIKAQP